MKNVFKCFLIFNIVIFLVLYFSYGSGYYINKNKEKSILTDEKIKEYEDDLKNGVDVSKNDYIVVLDTYDNSYTRLSLSISSKIERVFNEVIKYLFKKIGEEIDK